jgi:hypothetical protein
MPFEQNPRGDDAEPLEEHQERERPDEIREDVNVREPDRSPPDESDAR